MKVTMRIKKRYWLYRRGRMFYACDTQTNRRISLETKNRQEAERIITAKNIASEQPSLNLALAKAYLSGSDPELAKRTWRTVHEQYCSRGQPQTQAHRRRQLASPLFDPLWGKTLIETTSADFLALLEGGGAMVHLNLRCMHNLALGLGWLPRPVLLPRFWPKLRSKPKRAITANEHQQIILAEGNTERRAFYEMLWHIGAAQSDAANLQAEDIDWAEGVLRYRRIKTKEWSSLVIGPALAALLQQLPTTGPLFPHISKTTNRARSAEFSRRCRVVKISGISLHSYRYAWAERARSAGYPERFAQDALGHKSRAVHHAYAKRAQVKVPSLEDYESSVTKKVIHLPRVAATA